MPPRPTAVALDPSQTTQQTVNANLKITLASGSAIENLTGGNGSDTLTGNTLNNTLVGNGGIDTISGGAGNDTIIGSSGGGVLLGGAGNDTITGGVGRSVLIGGAGNDTLTGGANGDILINGTTNFDANAIALAAILAEWQSANSYTQRIADLRAGVGVGNADKLTWATTVADDGGANTLRGQPTGSAEPGGEERDWFFSNFGAGADALPDKAAAETLNNA